VWAGKRRKEGSVDIFLVCLFFLWRPEVFGLGERFVCVWEDEEVVAIFS